MKLLQRHNIIYQFWQHQFSRKNYAYLEQQDINYFKTILPHNSVFTDPDIIEPHNLCFRKVDKGNSKLLLCPHNTQQVSNILSYCNKRLLAVVPQGGNTGLVGGSVPVFDEIILNLKNMNKIQKFNEVNSVVNVEAGVILQKLNEYLEPYGFETPLDLGAKGSCQIGGNASTNAGGKYVIKYGSFRSHILGLQAVLPSGVVLDLRSEIHKDNTGFDLKHLFIGGEGTIGIITKLNIHCQKIDKIKKILVFKTDNFQTILKNLPLLKKQLGKNLAALQYMDGHSYQTILKNLHGPIFDNVDLNQHLLFVQTSTEELDQLFEKMVDFNDSIMSNNDKQFNKIWKIRQDLAVAASKQKGRVLAYDISFDVRQWPALLKHLRSSTNNLVMGYGHIGDGNLHVNIIMGENQQFKDSSIFEQVARRKGSISAEHGVGLHKPSYLHLQKSDNILGIYRDIKKLFDPNGILNPHKMIPE